MPAALIAGGIAATVGGAVISSNAQKSATRDATRAAQQATDQNIGLQREIYAQNKGVLTPFIDSGTRATSALDGLLYSPDGGTAALTSSPGYQFRFDQGMNALNTGYAARGLLNSGAAQKAALRFGQDYASGERAQRINELSQQQGIGLSAGGALAGVGTNYASNVSNQNNALASVLANSALARGQATGQMWGSIGNAFGQLAGQLPGQSFSSYKPPQTLSALSGAGAMLGRYSTPVPSNVFPY